MISIKSRIALLSTLLGGIVTFVSTPGIAATIRVPADAATIQEGIDTAAEGDTVLVASGTYTGDGNHSISFSAITSPEPHNIVLLSEDGPDVTIIDVQGSEQTPRRGFIFNTGESSASILDGFTITNGFMSVEESRTDAPHDLSGGAIIIRNFNTSPIIRNCVFVGNHSQFSGGGVEVELLASPTIENCVFRGNSTSLEGGGLSLESFSTPVLKNCLFVGNYALTDGGGIGISTGNQFTPIRLIGCTIAGNRANGTGGGLNVRFPAFVEMERSIVWNNCASDGTDTHAVSIDSGLSYVCAIVDSATAAVPGTLTYDPDTRFDDPYFCESVACDVAPTNDGDYQVAEDSIALTEFSSCGAAIGGAGAGCPPVVPTRPARWSDLKRLGR